MKNSRKRSMFLCSQVERGGESHQRINKMVTRCPVFSSHSTYPNSRASRSKFRFYFSILWLACFITIASSQDERAILESFYDGTGGPSWVRHTNWKTSSAICTWFGITCEDGNTNGDQNVVQIDLNQNNLNGEIPPEFWRLPKLERVFLRGNNILDGNFQGLATENPSPVDTIILPENQLKSIAGVQHAKDTLKSLNVNKNQLNEPLEDVFFELSNLETLYLAFNQISGTLSTQVGQLNRLTELYMFENNLSGELPSELGLLDKCEILGLGNNDWTGTLPTELNQMANLRDLSIHRVKKINTAADNSENPPGLTGPLLAFDSMPFLSLLLLDGNLLTGTIPDEFLRHNKNVKSPISISLTGNKLKGSLPNELSRFARLFIDVTGNQIESLSDDFCSIGGWMGGLVEEFGCDAILCPKSTFAPGGRATAGSNCEPCPGSEFLGARDCDSAASVMKPWEVMLELYTQLGGPRWKQRNGWEKFDEAETDFSGGEDFASIDFCNGFHGIVCQNGQIVELVLAGNNLFGTLPESILSLSSLEVLNLSRNNLVVPDFSGGSSETNLATIKLSDTKVQSLDGIEKFTALKTLYLDGTDMGGKLPTELFELTQLEFLRLQHGNVEGPLPSEIGKLTKLVGLDLDANKLTGTLPAEIGNLSAISTLHIAQNNFQGSLPPQLNGLQELSVFAAHHSNFDGTLPSLDDLPNLTELDLQFNSFTGAIPENFVSGIIDKASRVKISLQFNALEGDIPEGLQEFDDMVVELEGNEISGIPPVLCQKDNWMVGQVGMVTPDSKCDAILCASGTWNEFGKATSTNPCLPCATSEYYGQVFCGNDKSNLEKEILDKLFTATSGRYWSLPHDNWMRPGVPICSREGVQCAGGDLKNEDVLELRLNQFGLRGTIPSEIWQLPKLRSLGLTENPVSISFQGIESATSLIVLKTSECQIRSLEGIEKAPNKLAEVHLARNQFDGVIPDEIFSLTSVQKLFLNDNFFSGTLSKSIGLLTNLRTLMLDENRLSGPIPAELETLENLSELNFARQEGVGFEGPLPVFENNPMLTKVDFSSNGFSGWLPPTFLDSVDPSLEISVDLSHNRLTGPIPESWDRFESLNIELAANMITEIAPVLCSKSNWNLGQIGTIKSCDAILCDKGTYLSSGRQTDKNQPCQACSGGVNAAPFYGAVKCEDPKIREEREILVNFYQKTNGLGWKESTKWLSSATHCSWFGVVCTRQGRVREIMLPSNLLKASESSAVSAASLILTLSELETVDLSGNEIELSFSTTVGSSKLKHLSLSETGLVSLTGISRASGIKSLHLTNNMINNLPDEVYTLTDLELLYVSFNELSGPISTKLGMLTKLKEFYAFENKLSGEIPTEVGRLNKLTDFVVGHNMLSGEIPSQFSSLPSLEQLSVNEQKGRELITGPVPTFAGATNLWSFDASQNDLTGSIPLNFMSSSVNTDKAVSIHLQNNEISGSIPDSLKKFQRLDLNLAGNRISVIPPSLCQVGGWMNGNVGTVGNCSAILCPEGTYNQFGHHVPGTPCFACPRLENIFLGQTQCDDNMKTEYQILDLLFEETGGEFWANATFGWQTEAPVCSWSGIRCDDGDLQDTSGVTSIVLPFNSLSGTLPSEIWSLPSLTSVDLRGNPNLEVEFTGLFKAGNTLKSLYLSGVQLESMSGISQASSLELLDVSQNEIFELLPEELFALANTLEHLDIRNNRFYGSLPTDIGRMTLLKDFNAAYNQFLSTIPTEIGLMVDLERLDLSENLLYGPLPQELSSMPNLQVFACSRQEESGPKLFSLLPAFDRIPKISEIHLQGNEIQGTIPENFLSSSKASNVVDLSNNLISGTVPSSLLSISSLNLHLDGNKISGFPATLCELNDWMEGKIGQYGCDAFLCPPGSASPTGKATDSSTQCSNCTTAGVAPYFGSTSCEGPASEREILLNLYAATGGELWTRNDFWGSLASHCDWYGVACAGEAVVELNLRGNNLTGKTPSDLWSLQRLEILALYSNPVQVDFENIARAENLIDLRLDSTHLQSLRGIGAARSLISLDVRHSDLRGQFPQEIFQLTNLRTLSMSGNRLTGSLPLSFSALDNLVSLHLDENDFKGRLPSFDDLRMLRILDLSRNDFSGEIPRDFLAALRSSEALLVNFAQNSLTGVIPEELERFENLSLFARENRILGLPVTLCRKDQWNRGDVEDYGCDAILCKPGTSNRYGRRRPGSPCVECGDARYYGETLCSASHKRLVSTLLAFISISSLIWTLVLS